jgi:polyisoprenoid-binding protein YceI
MKTYFLFLLIGASALMGANLDIVNGSVKAHTEVIVDSHIDPVTTGLKSHLDMPQGIESMRGSVDISVKDLISNKPDRDEHMHKAIESDKYPLATYTFQSVTGVGGDRYDIDGVLKFHGVQKALRVMAYIHENGNDIVLKGKSAFKMSDYGVKPPRLILISVRDRIDLTIDAKFRKR